MKPRAAVASIVLLAAGCGGPADPAPPAPPGQQAPGVPAKPEAQARSAADPMKDAAAWKALPEADRAARAQTFVNATDAENAAALTAARTFLTERGETAAVAALAKRALAKGSTAQWAHEAAGDVDLAAEVDACLKASELAEEAKDPAYVILRKQRGTLGSMWADAETAKKLRAQCEELKKADELLGTPYGQGVQQWVNWQRSIEVMKDSAALHGARGPYLIFVSLDPPKVEKGSVEFRRGDGARIEDVPAESIARGNKILKRNLALMTEFYDGWMSELGPIFGFTRYTEANSTAATLLKMNVFTKSQDYQIYNEKTGGGMGGFARAYYHQQEPRFITTYDGSKDAESPMETDQTQCHEATHQLSHFYTWDLTRQQTGREPEWTDSMPRPSWSEEGFAEFFSSFAFKDGKRIWMQPLDTRLSEIHAVSDVVAGKKWAPWELKEFMDIRHAGALIDASQRRARDKQADVKLAENLMGNLFYAKAWSLNYFLWYAQEGGKPKYRDRFIAYKKLEFHLRFKFEKSSGVHLAQIVTAGDLRRLLGLETEEALRAFEAEWLAFEGKLIAERKQPSWDRQRLAMRKYSGLDK